MKTILAILLTLSFVSCTSSSVKKEVYSEMDSVPASKSMTQVMKRNKETIQKSKHLSEEQKTQLLKLQDRTYAQVFKYTADITKLKKVLFNNFAKKEYNDKKINYIAKKIKKISKDKMDLMFSSLKEARKILKGVDDRNLNQAIFIMDREGPTRN